LKILNSLTWRELVRYPLDLPEQESGIPSRLILGKLCKLHEGLVIDK